MLTMLLATTSTPGWAGDPEMGLTLFWWMVLTVVLVVAGSVLIGWAMTRTTREDEKREARAQAKLEQLLEKDRREADLVRRRAEADAGRIDEITTELR